VGVGFYVFIVFGEDAEEEKVFRVVDCFDDESIVAGEVEE
jgi:hypothetical protein